MNKKITGWIKVKEGTNVWWKNLPVIALVSLLILIPLHFMLNEPALSPAGVKNADEVMDYIVAYYISLNPENSKDVFVARLKKQVVSLFNFSAYGLLPIYSMRTVFAGIFLFFLPHAGIEIFGVLTLILFFSFLALSSIIYYFIALNAQKEFTSSLQCLKTYFTTIFEMQKIGRKIVGVFLTISFISFVFTLGLMFLRCILKTEFFLTALISRGIIILTPFEIIVIPIGIILQIFFSVMLLDSILGKEKPLISCFFNAKKIILKNWGLHLLFYGFGSLVFMSWDYFFSCGLTDFLDLSPVQMGYYERPIADFAFLVLAGIWISVSTRLYLHCKSNQ